MKTIKTTTQLENYIANYEKTYSNEMDPIFTHSSKADVYQLKKSLEKNELYIYTLEDYHDFILENNDAETCKRLENDLNIEVACYEKHYKRSPRFVIDNIDRMYIELF